AQAYRPPLWPATLGLVYAAVGHRVPAARLADAALGAAGVALLCWVALRLYGRGAACWAGALGAIYLPLALGSSVLVSEPLEAALALLALGLALEGRAAAAGGGRRGAAMAGGADAGRRGAAMAGGGDAGRTGAAMAGGADAGRRGLAL